MSDLFLYFCTMNTTRTFLIIITTFIQLHTVAQSNFYSLNEYENTCDKKIKTYMNANDTICNSTDNIKKIIGQFSKNDLIRLTKYLQKQKKDSLYTRTATPHKIISYKKWNTQKLNIPNLIDVMVDNKVDCVIFVLAQALLETGNFTSNVCINMNNLFGLYNSKTREYYKFQQWQDSVLAYKYMIQYKYKGGNYLDFLRNIGYAEDPLYIYKIAKITKQLYEKSKHYP